MKKALLVACMLLGFLGTAQEHFPNKTPKLLIGKEVTIVESLNSSILGGYSYVYSDPVLSTAYMPTEKNSRSTKVSALLGREFKVTAVDSVKPLYDDEKRCRISLEATDGLKLYYKYDYRATFDYPFEVKGGLDVPPGFYCDYVEPVPSAIDKTWECLLARVTRLIKTIDKNGPRYSFTARITGPNPKKKDIITKVTLFFDNKETAVLEGQSAYASYDTANSVYYDIGAILRGKTLSLFSKQKLVAVKIGDEILPYLYGEKTKGVLNCMENLK
jgi:hypothetical protein